MEKFNKDSNGYDIFVEEYQNGESNYISSIKKTFQKKSSKVSNWILEMNGMSGKKYRHFINNLIGKVNDPRYLEIGCWKGSTSCSAICNNDVVAYCIDNWSEFGGPKDIFCDNVQKCVEECGDIDITFVESDFRNIDYNDIGKYNVYLFDGPHSEQDHYDGLFFPQSALEDEFIFICDDWNWKKVRESTLSTIQKLNLNIVYSLEVKTTSDDSYPPENNTMENSDWHNGYYISVLKKSEIN